METGVSKRLSRRDCHIPQAVLLKQDNTPVEAAKPHSPLSTLMASSHYSGPQLIWRWLLSIVPNMFSRRSKYSMSLSFRLERHHTHPLMRAIVRTMSEALIHCQATDALKTCSCRTSSLYSMDWGLIRGAVIAVTTQMAFEPSHLPQWLAHRWLGHQCGWLEL